MREYRRSRHDGAKGLGPQEPTKKLARQVDLFSQPLYQKPVFKIVDSNRNFVTQLPVANKKYVARLGKLHPKLLESLF